jgi:hypothetical protein
MSVDRFLSPEERTDFIERQGTVLKTAEHYGVGATNALLIGGGALALYGVDTHVPDVWTDFDLDVINVGPEHNAGRLGMVARRRWRPPVGSYGEDPDAPLDLTRVGGDAAVMFARKFFKYPNYDSMMRDRVILPASGLATWPFFGFSISIFSSKSS